MMSILEEIYNDSYHVQARRGEEPKELRERNLAFWEKVAEALGDDVLDQHMYDLDESEHIQDVHRFREGFKLGVLMMLEVFGTQ